MFPLAAVAPFIPAALQTVAPIVQQVLGGATQGGGSNPLQALMNPLSMLFGQAQGPLSSFRPTPAPFQLPNLGGVGGSLGDVSGGLASAAEKLKSLDPFTSLEGQKELNAIRQAITVEQEINTFVTNLALSAIKKINQ